MLLGVGAGLVAVGLTEWRLGLRIIAGSLGAAALMRLSLPEKDAGMLAVRHRLLDVGILLGVAIALVILAGSIPEQPV